jgi:hypothetical protein
MSLLGLSLAIGVLIDDAIVVRENIVRHMERGKDRARPRARAPPRSAWRWPPPPSPSWRCSCRWPSWAAGPGEWFRPFGADRGGSVHGEPVHQLHARPHAVGLLGRPAGHHHAPSAASAAAARFNVWFDHQADRYGRVIAWALHHRRWMALIAVASLVARIALQAKFGGSSFPAGRPTPASWPSRCARRLQQQPGLRQAEGGGRGGAGAHLPETKATNSLCQRRRRAHLCGHRQEHRAPAQCRRGGQGPARARGAPGRRRVRGAGRPEQRRAEAGADPLLRPDSAASCWRSPPISWPRCARCKGAVDVGCPSRTRKTS